MMPESGAQPVDVPDHRGDLDETPRRTGVFLFFLVVLLLAVAAGIFFFADRLANDQESSNTQVPVPDVVGQTQDVAVGNLQTAGFQVEVETEENPDVDAGTVISQRPDGATEADDGSTVTIVVSAGEDPVEIPDVTGLMEPAATRQLENAGFEVSAERQTNDDIDEGVVSDTRPAVGNLLAPGETVIIIVSSGPDEVTVPDVSGQSVPSAQNILIQDGCSAANQVSEPSTAFASGIVIRTSPGAGTKVSSNQCNVTLVVSSGPPPTTAPPPTTSPPTT